MEVTIVDHRVYLRLSRRNLRQLNAMLENRDRGNGCLARRNDNGVCLVVHVDDDADHYKERDPGPGLGKVA